MDERLLEPHPSDRSAAWRRFRGALVALVAIAAFVTAPSVALADTPDSGAPQQTEQPPAADHQATEPPATDQQANDTQATEPRATDQQATAPPADPQTVAPPADLLTAQPDVDPHPADQQGLGQSDQQTGDQPPADEEPAAPAEPIADEPNGGAPVDDEPGEQPTDDGSSGGDHPTTDPPPGQDPPADPDPKPPVDTPPATDPPVEQPPVEEPPVEQRPTAVDPPVELPPVDDTAPAEDEPPAETPPVADDRRDERPPADTSTPGALPKPPSGSGTLRPVLTVPEEETTAELEQDAPIVSAPEVLPTLDPLAAPPISLPDVKHATHAADAADAAAEAAARDAAAKRIVRTTLVRLGIVSADPVAEHDEPASRAVADGQFCAPVVVSAAAPTPSSGTTRLQVVKSPRRDHSGQQPANVRGPPVGPLDYPSSPLNASAAAAPGSGSAAGISFFAILVGSVSAQLAQAEAVAPPCSFASNSATPTSDDSARAPPAS